MSEQEPQGTPKYTDHYSNAVSDPDKARFMAYAEKPNRDRARWLKRVGDEALSSQISKLQEQGGVVAPYPNTEFSKKKFDEAIGQLDEAKALEQQADHISDLAAETYERSVDKENAKLSPKEIAKRKRKGQILAMHDRGETSEAQRDAMLRELEIQSAEIPDVVPSEWN